MPSSPLKHLHVLRPFVLSGVLAGLVGSGLGYVLLEQSQWNRTAPAWPASQLHAQLQLFGFLLPLVIGFATFLVPRLSGGEPVRLRGAVFIALTAFCLASALTVVEPFVPRALLGWVRGVDGAAIFAATITLSLALFGPLSRFCLKVGGRGRAGYILMLEVSLGALALAGAADAIAWWRAGASTLPHLDEAFARAAWRLSLEGFTVGMALGVSARMFTGFLGISPSRAYLSPAQSVGDLPRRPVTFFLAVGVWAASLIWLAWAEILTSPRWVAIGELVSAVGLLPLCLRLGLAPADPRIRIDRSHDAAFPWGARSAYALLAAAEVLGGVGGAFALGGSAISPAWMDVRRHLIALGFVMTLITTMAGRLAPGFARRKLKWPQLRWVALVAFPLAALLRIGEGVANEWGVAMALKVSAASGPVALVAFGCLFASLIATLLGAPPREA